MLIKREEDTLLSKAIQTFGNIITMSFNTELRYINYPKVILLSYEQGIVYSIDKRLFHTKNLIPVTSVTPMQVNKTNYIERMKYINALELCDNEFIYITQDHLNCWCREGHQYIYLPIFTSLYALRNVETVKLEYSN